MRALFVEGGGANDASQLGGGGGGGCITVANGNAEKGMKLEESEVSMWQR